MKLKHIAALSALLMAGAAAQAQNTYSGYFNDNYLYRYQMNPAFDNERNFVSIPALGNINLSMQGNLHVSDLIYNVDGKTVLFTNPGVTDSEFLSKIKDKNRIGADLKLNVLSTGFRAFGGYNTVSINARTDLNVKVPGSLFRLAKEGVENKTYDIQHLGLNAEAFAEIALGHSRKILPNLRVGATLKFLIGVGNIDARLNEADLTLGENSWIARTNADVYSSVKGLTYKTKVNSNTGREYVSGIDMDGFGLNGFGMALDLGGIYKLNSDWEFSLALLDFGFMSYGNTQLATTDGTQTVETDAYHFSAESESPNSFKNEWQKMRDDLSALYQMSDKGDIGTRTHMLGATLNIAAQYNFPLYNRLHFGLVNSTRINGTYSWTQFRLAANVRPVDCFSADANVAVGTFGWSFGWLLNLNVTGFNFFVGMDHTLGKLAKQGVPLSSNASVNFGMNIPF